MFGSPFKRTGKRIRVFSSPRGGKRILGEHDVYTINGLECIRYYSGYRNNSTMTFLHDIEGRYEVINDKSSAAEKMSDEEAKTIFIILLFVVAFLVLLSIF